jgi:DNA-binding LacI/PurR family transcriptional regulator
MAIGAIRAALGAGRAVPEDLSIIGFDDIEWALHNFPPLTTINIPKRQMGQEAARRLLSLLDDPELLPTEITVSVRLVKRESTQERR